MSQLFFLFQCVSSKKTQKKNNQQGKIWYNLLLKRDSSPFPEASALSSELPFLMPSVFHCVLFEKQSAQFGDILGRRSYIIM